jgi:hypothetical protein
MNKAGLTFLCFILLSSAFAQSPLSVKWLNNSKGSGWDLVSDMVIDNKNNVYVVGNYKDTTHSDKRMFGSQEDIFIARYNSYGDSIWMRQLKSDNYCHIKSIVIGSSGQSFISGYQYNADSRDSISSTKKNLTKLFIDKLDENGEKSEFTIIEGNFNTMPIRVVERNNLGILVGGSFSTLIYNDSTYKSEGKTDIFLWAFDQKGKPGNLLLLRGYGKNTLNDIKIDQEGNVYLTGAFERELKIHDQVFKSNGRSDSYLAKLNPELKVQYLKQHGGIYTDYGKSLEVDSLNNVIVTGSFSGQLVTESHDTLVSKGKLDVFIMKYNPNGELLWTRNFGGLANEYVSSCILNTHDDVYVNGSFRGEIEEGDFKIKSAGFSSDAFVAKYTGEGQFRFIEAIGDTNTDFAGRMLIDSLNYIYLTGNYNQNMKVLNDTTEKGAQEDFYLTKLYDCDFSPKIKLPNDTSVCESGFVIVADSGFSKYLWNEMGGDYQYSVDTTGRYYLKAYDEQGCITADTIYVRINMPLQVDLGNDLRVKQGELVLITTNDQFEEYLWSTSENTPYIQMVTDEMKPGGYPIGITTKDVNGCITRDQLLLEVEGLVEFSIYPVPAKHTVSLLIQNIEPDKNIDYQLVTESGSVVFDEAQISVGDSFTKEIDIQNLEPGVYYLKVQYDELTSTLKVIKM